MKEAMLTKENQTKALHCTFYNQLNFTELREKGGRNLKKL